MSPSVIRGVVRMKVVKHLGSEQDLAADDQAKSGITIRKDNGSGSESRISARSEKIRPYERIIFLTLKYILSLITMESQITDLFGLQI
jgi:hypothetical protein